MPRTIPNLGTIAWKENTFREFKENYDRFMMLAKKKGKQDWQFKENEIVRNAIYKMAEDEANGRELPDPAKYHQYWASPGSQVNLKFNEGHTIVDVNEIPAWYNHKDVAQAAHHTIDPIHFDLNIWDGMEDARFGDMNGSYYDKELIVTSNGAFSGGAIQNDKDELFFLLPYPHDAIFGFDNMYDGHMFRAQFDLEQHPECLAAYNKIIEQGRYRLRSFKTKVTKAINAEKNWRDAPRGWNFNAGRQGRYLIFLPKEKERLPTAEEMLPREEPKQPKEEPKQKIIKLEKNIQFEENIKLEKKIKLEENIKIEKNIKRELI